MISEPFRRTKHYTRADGPCHICRHAGVILSGGQQERRGGCAVSKSVGIIAAWRRCIVTEEREGGEATARATLGSAKNLVYVVRHSAAQGSLAAQ